MMKKNIILFKFILIIILIQSCKDKWEDHIQLSDQIYDGSLMEKIQENSDLSLFSQYLVSTGLDKLLQSGSLSTVWAPTNEAFGTIDPSVLEDTAQLKLLIGNHISLGIYLAQGTDSIKKLEAVNTKLVSWSSNTSVFEGAQVKTSNLLCKNGALHVIEKVIIPKKNLWELINSAEALGLAPKNAAFLSNYSYVFFDEANSVKIGVDSAGRSVYDSVKYNVYYLLQDVNDVRDEKKYFTFFLLTDQAFEDQSLVYKNYFKQASNSETDSTTWLNISKDYLFEAKFDAISDTLVNNEGIRIPIDKSAITDTLYASNGVIYILSGSTIPLTNKVRTILIEGESDTRRLFSTNYGTYTLYKEMFADSASGKMYMFINEQHNIIDNYFEYPVKLFSCKYKAYWLSYVPSDSVDQIFAVYMNNTETLVATKKQTTSFTEVYLGEYTPAYFGDAYLRAKCTLGKATKISLDYIKLIPVLP